MDGAAIDSDAGLLRDRASHAAIGFRCVFVNQADARTAAEHVATIGPVYRGDVATAYIIRAVVGANLALVDGDVGVPADVSVLGAAKHRAVETRTVRGTVFLARLANLQVGVVHIAEEHVGTAFVEVIDLVGFHLRRGHTTATAEDRAVRYFVFHRAFGINRAFGIRGGGQHSEGAARDGDVAVASASRVGPM